MRTEGKAGASAVRASILHFVADPAEAGEAAGRILR